MEDVPFTHMSMPKTTIYKNYSSVFGQNYIRFSW